MTEEEVLNLKEGDILQSNISHAELKVIAVRGDRLEYTILKDQYGKSVNDFSICSVEWFQYYRKVVTIEGFEL